MNLAYTAVVSGLLFTLVLQTRSETSQAKTASSTQAPSKKSVSSSSQASKNKKTPTKTQETGAHQFGQSYATLRPEQKELIDDLVRRYNQTTGSKIVAEQGYDAARVSLRTTFDAVTHALLTAKLTDEKGKSLGRAIDLVDALDAVMGEEQGVGGDRQFRLYVYLKPNAFDTLSKSIEFYRDRDNTVYHKGFPTCFRLKNGPPSIQVSMSRDRRMADVDVDYRSSTFPKALFNGHLTASNSDVRAGNNLDIHDGRWQGLSGWWRELFASLGGSKPPKEEPTRNSNTVPLNPAVKADKGVQDSAHDFLKSWVVDREPNNAIAYFSRRSYPCLEDIAKRNGKPVLPGMVRVRIRIAMETFNEKTGKVTSVSDVFEPAANWSPELKETKNPYANEFRLVSVPADAGEDIECAASPTDDSAKKSKEKYFATAFQEKHEKPGEAKVMSLLWTQEGKYWKIVAIRIEDSGKEDIVPQIASASPSEPKPENFAGDAGVIRAATDFYQTWIVKRDAAQAAGFASPRSYQCLPPPSNAVEKERKPPERIRTGLASVFSKVPVSGSLSEMMSSVDPVNELIRPVDHANTKAFSLMAVPDQKAETFLCGQRHLPEKTPDLKPADATYGTYYLSASELNYGDENSPPLLLLWVKENDRWKVIAWAVEVP